MDILLDDDLRAVAEFMQRHVAAAKLVPIAEAMNALAPILWGRYGRDALTPLVLRERPISDCDQQTRSAAIGSRLDPVDADGGSGVAVAGPDC